MRNLIITTAFISLLVVSCNSSETKEPQLSIVPTGTNEQTTEVSQKDLVITITNGSATAISNTNRDFFYSIDDDIVITVNTDVDGEVSINHGEGESFFILGGAPVRYEFYPYLIGEFVIELIETKLELATITIL